MAKGNTKISLTQDDFEGANFKHAPAGTYFVKISPKSKVKEGNNGNLANLQLTITKGPHKGVNAFDNIAAHVGWKIAQVLSALGIALKKAPKTLEEFVKLVSGKDLRVVLKVEKYQGKKKNAVVTYLPLEADKDEDIDEDDDDADDDDEGSDDDADDDEETESDDDDEDDDEDEDEDEEEDSDDDDDDAEEDADEDDDEDEDDDSSDEDDDDDDEEEDKEELKERRQQDKKTAAKKTPAKRGAKKTAAKKTGRKR